MDEGILSYLFKDEDELLQDDRSNVSVSIAGTLFSLTLADSESNENKKTLFATHLWQGAKVLSESLKIDFVNCVRGKSVIEFGSAAGLPSMVAMTMNPKVVVATDYPSPSVLENLSRNLSLNRKSMIECASVDFKVMSHLWGDEKSMNQILSLSDGGMGFDLALAAECLWRSELHNDLAKSIYRSLRVGGTALVTFSHHFSGRDDIDLNFFKIAEEVGLRVISTNKYRAPHMWSDRFIDIHLYELTK